MREATLESVFCSVSVESVAQQVEHIPFKDGVLGSSPSWFTEQRGVAAFLFSVLMFFRSQIVCYHFACKITAFFESASEYPKSICSDNQYVIARHGAHLRFYVAERDEVFILSLFSYKRLAHGRDRKAMLGCLFPST